MLTTAIKTIRKNYLLTIILVFGFFLRLFLIDFNPPSLNWDEVSHGYNAYSILQTGKDEWGVTMPSIFRAYGDYKLPVYIYTTSISVAIFGLNAFAVRLPSVIAGTLLIYLTYFLTIELFRKKKDGSTNTNINKTAVLAAFLVSIEPWSLFLSRGAFEANLALFLFVSGIYFFLKGIEKPKLFLLSVLFFGFSVWTYNSYRVFTPLMFAALFIIFRKKLTKIFRENKKLTAYFLLLSAVLFLPMFYQMLHSSGQARYEWVAIVDEGAVAQIVQNRNDSQLPSLINRLLHNRPTFFMSSFTKNYVAHFSPNFLFTEGGSHYQFSVPDKGLLYPLNLPFFYIGLGVLIFNLYRFRIKHTKEFSLLAIWVLAAPIASSLTRESPHVLRAITFLPAPMILSAVGLTSSLKYLKKSKLFKNVSLILLSTYIIAFLLHLEDYLYEYYVDYRNNYSWSWQYGYKNVVEYSKENHQDYDKVIVTKKYGEPHEFFLFYWPWEPERYQTDNNLIRFEQSDWFWVDRFDKFYFVNDWEIARNQEQRIGNVGNYSFILESGDMVHCTPRMFNCLLITSPGNVPNGWKKINTIYFLNDEPAFEIYEN